jgi:TolB-like protein
MLLFFACGAPGPEASPLADAPVAARAAIEVPEPPALPAARRARTGALYAAFPPRNLTPEPGVGRQLLDGVQASLAARGASFVPTEDLELILRSEKIRYTDSVSVEAAKRIGETTGADHILLASVLVWELAPEPRIAVVLRVIDARTGQRVQSAAASLLGADFEGMLGLGAIETTQELEREILARVLDVFAADGSPLDWSLADDADAPSDALSFYVREGFDPSALETVAVMPLSNRSDDPDAGLLFSDLLTHECFRSAGVNVVERSELLAAMYRERVRSVATVDLETLARIGHSVGTRYFVMGSVERFGDEVWVNREFFPVVEAMVRVVDVESGRIVIAGAVRRRGDHYHRGFGLGMVRDATSLALMTARELVALLMVPS